MCKQHYITSWTFSSGQCPFRVLLSWLLPLHKIPEAEAQAEVAFEVVHKSPITNLFNL